MKKVALNNVELMEYLLFCIEILFDDEISHNCKKRTILSWWAEKHNDWKDVTKVDRESINTFVLHFE